MGWLSATIDRLATAPSETHTHAMIGRPGEPIAPERAYLRLWLRSARLVEARRWRGKL